MTSSANPLDCLVIGGGPAGLTAIIYLARFRLSVGLIDEGKSRAALIPRTRNHAGYPGGISGEDLIDRMRAQALDYDVQRVSGRVDRLERRDEFFEAQTTAGKMVARAVLLATGVTNRKPAMEEILHAEALCGGQLRYCPVCDGYEVTDKEVAVIGTGARAASEAMFLRAYTRDVTLIPNTGAHDLSGDEREQLAQAGVSVMEVAARAYALEGSRISVRVGAEQLSFDSIYPALGSDIHSDLAVRVGAAHTEEGCINVDSHQRTSVAFLYAAGDVVAGLDQISHAMGEAGVAATTIRNDLAKVFPLLR